VTYWVATMSESQQQAILEARQDVVEDWDIEYGDRQTQFVIIGTDVDQEKISRELDACFIHSSEIDEDWRLLDSPYQWTYDRRM
ncbi:GTP-binding protein, partial [Paraburkholderia tropica]